MIVEKTITGNEDFQCIHNTVSITFLNQIFVDKKNIPVCNVQIILYYVNTNLISNTDKFSVYSVYV